MVNGLKKSPVTGRGEWFQSVFLASKILHGAQSLFGSLIISRRCSVRWIGGWARLRASRRCHIFHQAHFCLSGKGLWWHALMDSLSKWTLTTSRDGQRNWRRRREKSSFVLPLKVRAVAWRGWGHYLASSPRRERKEENNFRPFNAPDFPLLSSSSSSSFSLLLAVRRHGRCQAAKSALCLPRTDRLLCLLACLGR